MLADVSAKLLGQFVENLEQTVLVDALEAEVEEAEEALEELVEEAVEEALEEAVEEALEVEAALEAVEEAVAEDEQDVVDQQAFVKAEAEVDRAVRRIDSPEPEAIDLLEHAGLPGAQAPDPGARRDRRGHRGVAPPPPDAVTGPAERARVAELLGRPPMGEFEVVVRRADGEPVVIRNHPLLPDGTPMPTRYWLVDAALRAAVGTLESHGGVRRAEAEVPADAVARAHAAYAAERDAAAARRTTPDRHRPGAWAAPARA